MRRRRGNEAVTQQVKIRRKEKWVYQHFDSESTERREVDLYRCSDGIMISPRTAQVDDIRAILCDHSVPAVLMCGGNRAGAGLANSSKVKTGLEPFASSALWRQVDGEFSVAAFCPLGPEAGDLAGMGLLKVVPILPARHGFLTSPL